MNNRSNDLGQRLAIAMRRHGAVITVSAIVLAGVLVGSIGFALTRPSPTGAAVAAVSTPSPNFAPSIGATPAASVAIVGASPSPSIDLPSVEPSTQPSTGVSTPTPPSTTSIAPTPSPTPAPTPIPSVRIWVGSSGEHAAYRIVAGTTVTEVLHLATQGLRRSECSLTHAYAPDDPTVHASSVGLSPLTHQSVALADGWHTFAVSCPSPAGKLTARVRTLAIDGKPEACNGFTFTREAITATSYAQLKDGVVGTWNGCVTTPWTPMYAVTVTLRDDGSYSAKTSEVLDDVAMIAMYWGSDAASPSKTYAINDLQASDLGVGQMDLTFDGGSVTRDELRNVRLMGDKLEFELFHFGQYGPVTFQLDRTPNP